LLIVEFALPVDITRAIARIAPLVFRVCLYRKVTRAVGNPHACFASFPARHASLEVTLRKFAAPAQSAGAPVVSVQLQRDDDPRKQLQKAQVGPQPRVYSKVCFTICI